MVRKTNNQEAKHREITRGALNGALLDATGERFIL
jgi:hypothetical protein